ncbi:hypothetical protein ZWY2020_036319 [Hordeum vulgare]|nr:hypothetical protein ZWY2020_036319 [Hordeum vulgare]
MALVPASSRLLVLVDAPAGSGQSSPRLMLAPAGVRLPSGVRAIAAVNHRLATFIAEATGRVGYGPNRTPGPGSVISEEAAGTGAWGWGYAPELLTLALAPRRAEAGEDLLQARGSHAMRAVGGGGGAAGGAGDYSGLSDDAAKGQADQVIELVQLRARLYVMADKVQTHFSIMHSYSSKSALPFDHPVHDLAPRFIKTLADIAERLYVNMDFLCFTVQLPVTLQQMATNNSKGLLQAFEAASDFNQVINPAVSKDMDTLKELQMYHRMLQAEDYKALDYVVGPLQGHVWAVAKALYNLNDELKPLRLHA